MLQLKNYTWDKLLTMTSFFITYFCHKYYSYSNHFFTINADHSTFFLTVIDDMKQ